MALNQYCEFDEVRAALGVDDEELSDATLGLPVYQIGLVRDLNRVSLSLPGAFSTISALAESARSAVQKDLLDAIHMFSVYSAARQVGASLGQFAPKTIADGKANVTRFSDSPYKDTMDRLDRLYAVAKADLSEALASYSGAAIGVIGPVFSGFLASKRGFDPVTGV